MYGSHAVWRNYINIQTMGVKRLIESKHGELILINISASNIVDSAATNDKLTGA